MSSVTLPCSASKPQQTYEFTKRKRWADLLVTEVTDSIIFVLSSTCKVLYCGAAITELLGWRNTDLIDSDLVDFVNPDDQVAFRASFNKSIRSRDELLSYVRLKPKDTFTSPEDAGEGFFEIKGYPHFVSEEQFECNCIFACARPYTSRNKATLNAFLSLKLENDRLQKTLLELKARASVPTDPPAPPSRIRTASITESSQRTLESQITYHVSPDVEQGGFDEMMRVPDSSGYDGTSYGCGSLYGSMGVSSNTDDDGVDDGSKRKKLKKTHVQRNVPEQYVCITCGRTDSPEWRKGPLGPKTLCNACGLRWAKQMRKHDDPAEFGDGSVVPST